MNLLSTKEWSEFENYFEEGWMGNPNVYQLANHQHHLEVAELAANNLSKIWKSFDDLTMSNWEDIIITAYNTAAKELYPNELLWSGDNEDNPDFWYEHIVTNKTKSLSYYITELWDEEKWGNFYEYHLEPSFIDYLNTLPINKDLLWLKQVQLNQYSHLLKESTKVIKEKDNQIEFLCGLLDDDQYDEFESYLKRTENGN